MGLLSLTLGYVWRMRLQPVHTGAPAMLGQPAEVLDWAGREGHVLAVGERWQARALQALAPGERVWITRVKGPGLIILIPFVQQMARVGHVSSFRSCHSTIIFPLPIDTLFPFLQMRQEAEEPAHVVTAPSEEEKLPRH